MLQSAPETVMITTMIAVMSEAVSEAAIEAMAAVGGTTAVAIMTKVEIENGLLRQEEDEVDPEVLPVDLLTGETLRRTIRRRDHPRLRHRAVDSPWRQMLRLPPKMAKTNSDAISGLHPLGWLICPLHSVM